MQMTRVDVPKERSGAVAIDVPPIQTPCPRVAHPREIHSHTSEITLATLQARYHTERVHFRVCSQTHHSSHSHPSFPCPLRSTIEQ